MEVVCYVLFVFGVSIIVLFLLCFYNGCDFVDNFYFVILYIWLLVLVDGI